MEFINYSSNDEMQSDCDSQDDAESEERGTFDFAAKTQPGSAKRTIINEIECNDLEYIQQFALQHEGGGTHNVNLPSTAPKANDQSRQPSDDNSSSDEDSISEGENKDQNEIEDKKQYGQVVLS